MKLSERKEALMAQIQEVDRVMLRLQGRAGVGERGGGRVNGTAPARGRKRRGGRRAKRGALKEKILALLRAAGSKGTTIRELSDKLGVRNANLYVWFNGTGRNVAGLKKVGPAKYRLS